MDPITKSAMDAAIASAVTNERERMNGVIAAKEFAKPWVGVMNIALDSAEQVYRGALDALKVPHKEVRETAALKAILNAQPKPGAAKPAINIAQDAAAEEGFAARFKNAARLRVA